MVMVSLSTGSARSQCSEDHPPQRPRRRCVTQPVSLEGKRRFMARSAAVALLVVVMLFAAAATGHAQRGGSAHGGGDIHGRSGAHGGRGSHSGGHFHGGVRGEVVIGPWWGFGYPYPYWPCAYGAYPPPYYGYPPSPYSAYDEPPAYVQREPEPQAYWYYCPSSRAYYPNIRECPEEWVKVSPRPPED